MEEPQSIAGGRWQFSLATMFLVMTIVCLATALVINSGRLSESQRQLQSLRPLSLTEVAEQFEKQTTLWPITTTVNDVRYSADQDSYKVRFSWDTSGSNQTWSTEVILKSNGYGEYYGVIRNEPFCQPTGHKDGFGIGIKSPSGLGK